MTNTLVMKFGGTSVGSAENLTNAVKLVAAERSRQPLVVVSALGGVTDMLVRLADSVEARDLENLSATLADIQARHLNLSEELLFGDDLVAYQESFFTDYGMLERLIRQLLSVSGTDKADRDHILSFGERFGSKMFCFKLRTLAPRAYWCDAHNFMITTTRFGNARPDEEATRAHLRQWVAPQLAQGRIVVTQGFVGATPHGFPTTLGRGGSDFTATYLATLLPASNIQIWTDVSGVYTADPRFNPQATPIPELSLQDAYRMARNGAKVLYPPCLLALRGKGIPLQILNTKEPEAKGTHIPADFDTEKSHSHVPLLGIATTA